MKTIKSFLYLDEYKMYSLSSQIFEGLTEYVVNYSAQGKQDLEKQSGPVGSGRVLADIISQEVGKEERKFLHDYSYALFEAKLFEDERVILINSDNINNIDINELDKYSFIKVVGRALFNDMEIINSTLSDLNNIGESLAYLTTFDHQGLNHQSSHIENKQTSKKQKGFSPQNTRNSSDLSKIAKSMNLQYDEEFLKKLSLLLSYGYKDLFEIQIFLKDNNNNKTIFSTNLKRNYLKEDEHLLIKKHSRYSEKELVVFGVITQNKGEISNLDIESETNPNPTKMKEFLRNFNLALLKIEEGFVGISSSEIIIDPIAVYREL